MRHARDQDLDRLEDLLASLRALPALKEKKRGVFYLKSRAFLHFHEDPKGLFADIGGCPDGGEFERVDVTKPDGQAELLRVARERLGQAARSAKEKPRIARISRMPIRVNP